MTDKIPELGCPPPFSNGEAEEFAKASEEFTKTSEYVIRTAESYLKTMVCIVPGGNHPTYDKDGKCLCVTLPASLVSALITRVKELENKEEKE